MGRADLSPKRSTIKALIMRWMVTGSGGQLGCCLLEALAADPSEKLSAYLTTPQCGAIWDAE